MLVPIGTIVAMEQKVCSCDANSDSLSHGEIAPGDLYQEYRDRVDDPKADRTIRNYLNKLEQYNLITAEGTTRDRIYRCVGTNGVSNPTPE